MTLFINTFNDYLKVKNTIDPVFVLGKRDQKVLIPCANTLLVKRDIILANTYNPNNVPDSKMEVLYQSIVDNGFAFPIICIFDNDLESFVVIDGFHRYLISGPKWLDMAYVPVAVLTHDASQRMIATWQFNKARGFHQVDMDADLIRSLIQQNMNEEEICKHLGITLETVYRYKQVTGIAELFKDAVYSMPWEMEEVNDEMEIR